jgi:hypothetical protein
MVTPQGEMQADVHSVTRYPDAQRVVMKMPMGEVTRVVSPEASFMITPMGTQDMPSSQRDSSLADLRSELVAVLKNLDNPKYTFTAGATEGDARVLEINADGNAVKWQVDPATGRVLRTMSREMVSELGEWKSFGGLNLPTMTVLTRNGEKAGEVRVANVEVNPAIDAKAFVKP